MEQNSEQLMAERFKVLPEELKKFIVSEELSRKISLVARKYRLTAEQERILQNEIAMVLLVIETEDNLSTNFEQIGLASDLSVKMAFDVSDYILKKVSQYIAHTKDDLTIVEEKEPVTPAPTSIPTPQAPASRAELKEAILAHIENPPRTVLKRYVLEHDPITDPSHLIDDRIDNTIKLEEHYDN